MGARRCDRKHLVAAPHEERGLPADMTLQHLAIAKRRERHALAEIGSFD